MVIAVVAMVVTGILTAVVIAAVAIVVTGVNKIPAPLSTRAFSYLNEQVSADIYYSFFLKFFFLLFFFFFFLFYFFRILVSGFLFLCFSFMC